MALEDGREFTVARVDRDHDGLVESGDNISVAGPFDSGDCIIALYFEPSYATISSVTTHMDQGRSQNQGRIYYHPFFYALTVNDPRESCVTAATAALFLRER